MKSTLNIINIALLLNCPIIYRSTNASVLTKEEFDSSIRINGYPIPEDKVYRYFDENTTDDFSRNEIAMLVAQLIHESGGFQFTEQLACLKAGDRCQGRYIDAYNLPNKTYHGRGYIQLTWAANYKVASEGLGMKDLLLKNPEIVAEDTRIAMLVSVWYWRARVRPLLLKSRENHFGVTTRAINPEECAVRVNALARRRYRIYLKVAEVMKIEDKAKENGCYD